MRKLEASLYIYKHLLMFCELKRATNNKHLHTNIEILYFVIKLKIKSLQRQ